MILARDLLLLALLVPPIKKMAAGKHTRNWGRFSYIVRSRSVCLVPHELLLNFFQPAFGLFAAILEGD